MWYSKMKTAIRTAEGFMKSELMQLSCEIELQPGEKLTLPLSLIESAGAGRWTFARKVLSLAPPKQVLCRHTGA